MTETSLGRPGAATLDTGIGGMQTRAVEPTQLGEFVLVVPLATSSTAHRFFLARHASEAADAPPTYIAKTLLLGNLAHEIERLRAGQFAHEIQLHRAFNHSCIPTCHDAGDQDGLRYIILDYIDGVSLAQLLGHDGDHPRSVSKEVAVYLLAQVADALHHIHTFGYLDPDSKDVELGALHRDVSPANIFLSPYGDVLLGDFDAASSSWLPEEYAARDAGSIAYKAPERVSGSARASVQSDLFSLATILWEMLKGERCFRGEDDLSTMDAIVRFDIAHPKRRVAGLSTKLSEIVRRNLDRDPERRYTGAYQVLQRLAQSPEASTAETARRELAGLVCDEYARRYGKQPPGSPLRSTAPDDA